MRALSLYQIRAELCTELLGAPAPLPLEAPAREEYRQSSGVSQAEFGGVATPVSLQTPSERREGGLCSLGGAVCSQGSPLWGVEGEEEEGTG